MTSLPDLPVIDHSKVQFVSAPSTFKANPELYEREWAPKVKAYNDKLAAAMPEEYLVPSELLPEDLDAGHFNATLIPPKVLDEESLKITELSAVVIAEKIAAKEYSAVQVFTAFTKRATIAHQLTHCAMEIFFDEGLERAKELDEYQAKEGKTIGPLHGVPISLKEHFNYKGHVTHRSFVGLLDNVPDSFAVTSQILYDLGAVFYIRTTMPQCLMHADSINSITGRGRNAHKTSMSPGGSSSGEGAIVAMKGSALGIGGDIGGSVRFPAAFNGTWGLKPTTKRISGRGCGSSADTMANEGILATLGPLTNSVEDIEFLMKAYLSTEPWLKDQSLVPIPWREVATPKPSELTIGIVYDDGIVKPHPPIVRAMKIAEKKLKAAGVNVVTWEPHKVWDCIEIIAALFGADGNLATKKKLAISGEPIARLTEGFLAVGRGDKGLEMLEYMTYVKDRETLRQEYLDLFNSRGVDFLLTPTYVGVAPKPETPGYAGYTVLWNIMDSTCVTFPTGLFADKTIDPKDESYEPRNLYEKTEYGLYDAEYSDGLPIGLTVVGRRYTEESALKASKVISEAMAT